MYKFKTVKTFNETEIKEKGSTFIGQVYPVEDESEALKILEAIKKKYYDTSHHCFAYNLYEEKFRYTDAGEPSGTAGIRILNAIHHFDLQNVLVTVIRYFGGTKLGVGLLGKTYYNAAYKILESSSFIEKKGYQKTLLEGELCQINNIHHLINLGKGKISNSEYQNRIKIECYIPCENIESFNTGLKEISHGEIKIFLDEKIIFY